MSSCLYAKQEPKKIDGVLLDNGLKIILHNRLDVTVIDKVLTNEDIPYLQGLLDGGVKGAGILIDMIERYEQVRVYESY